MDIGYKDISLDVDDIKRNTDIQINQPSQRNYFFPREGRGEKVRAIFGSSIFFFLFDLLDGRQRLGHCFALLIGSCTPRQIFAFSKSLFESSGVNTLLFLYPRSFLYVDQCKNWPLDAAPKSHLCTKFFERLIFFFFPPLSSS